MEKTSYCTCPHCCQVIEIRAKGTEITEISVSKDSTVASYGRLEGAQVEELANEQVITQSTVMQVIEALVAVLKKYDLSPSNANYVLDKAQEVYKTEFTS